MAEGYGDRSNPLLAYVWPDGSFEPLMPGRRPDNGQSRYEARGVASWTRVEATSQWLWRWQSPIFDLRPEFAPTDNAASGIATVPINRTAVFGSGAWLRVIVWTHSTTVDIANLGGLTVEYWEAVNDQPPQQMTNQAVAGVPDAPLFRVSQPTDVTDFVSEGGQTANVGGQAYRGACLLPFSAPAEGTRFWQVTLEWKVDKDDMRWTPDTLGVNWQASVY